MSEYKELAELIAGDFREVLADKKLKGEDRIAALVAVVGRLHEGLAGVDMNGVNGAVETVYYNDDTVALNIDGNGRIESVDCPGAHLSFFA